MLRGHNAHQVMAERQSYSLVIPLYNKRDTVLRAVRSALSQEHEVEIIVVDDGSSDGGADLVRGLNDPSIRIVSQENRGVSSARNRGVRESTQALVAFLDADDEWLNDYLDIIDGLVERFPEAGAYATSFQYVYGDRLVRKGENSQVKHPYSGVPDFFACVRERELFCTGSIVVRKEAFLGIGGFDEGMWYGEDTDAWVRLALNARIAYDSAVGMNYYQDASNRAMTLKRPITRHFIDSVNEYRKTHPQVDENLLSFANRHLCLVVIKDIGNGFSREARRLLSRRPSNKELHLIVMCYGLSLLPRFVSSSLFRAWNDMRTN